LKNLFDHFERYLIRFIVFTLVLLVVVQGIMTHDSYRLYLSWAERMEGEEINYPASQAVNEKGSSAGLKSPRARIVVDIESFSSLPLAKVLVNGQVRCRFDHKEVMLLVKGGDKLEIDSSMYDFPVNYRIRSVSANVSFPESNSCFSVDQGVVMIGNVIVK